MVEHEVCIGCQWNKYPLCEGTKMADGKFMNIENLKPNFQCGQKDVVELTDFSIVKKSDLELRIDDLELRIAELELRIEELNG